MAIILSREEWNDTGIDLVKDQIYKYTAKGIWIDWHESSNADGYSKPIMDAFGFMKRVPSAKWFQLIGVIDKKADLIIKLGAGGTFVSPGTGRLWAYANDHKLFYWNNQGQIELDVH